MHVLQLVTNEEAPFFQQQVSSLAQRGITSDVRSPDGIQSGTESRSRLAYLRLATETLREPDDYDLVHANYALTAPAAFLQTDTPTVLSLWGSDLLGVLGPFSQACATLADEVIVMSSEMGAVLGGPSHVIPHGIDLDRFRPLGVERSRTETGWDSDGKHVLFPYGPHRSVKDFPKAANVVESVREQVDAPVILHTLSGVDHSRMPYYYNAADAVLITSEWEGSPNAVREALACNTPVVATDVGDVSSRVDGLPLSSTGSTPAAVADGLANALTADRSETGRPRAAETSVEEMTDDIQQVYNRAL